MKNNTICGKIRGLLGSLLFAFAFAAVLPAAADAQSNNLYYATNGSYYGRVTVYPTHFEIRTNNAVIKTFRNSCRSVTGNGLLCTFGQFDTSGRHWYSGQGYFFQNGYVYLRWTNENIGGGGSWRTINTPWYAFVPR